MAKLLIKKYKNNNSKNNGYGKTYGRMARFRTIDGLEILSDEET